MKNNCQIIFNNEDIKNKIKNCDLIFIFFNDFINYKEKKFFLFDFLKKNNHSFIEKKFHYAENLLCFRFYFLETYV